MARAAGLTVVGLALLACHKPSASSGPAVADSLTLADSAFSNCHGLSGDAQADCYDGVLVPLVASHGVRTAMGTLRVLGARDDRVRVDGHVYAHAIGMAAGRATGARAFTDCTEIFQSGCYHGVIQAYFERARAVDAAGVNALCGPYVADQWLRFQCVHGAGHGLTMFYDHDLPRALAGCDLLRTAWDRESCYGGAFMENIVNATAPHHAGHAMHPHTAAAPFKALDPADLHYPCSIVARHYLTACYNMQTSVMLYFTHGDMAATARHCLDAPPGLEPVCFQGLGREVSAYSHQDHQEAIRMCGLARVEYQPWCHVGVVKNFVDLTARPDDGIAYCRALTGTTSSVKCYEAVGEEIATLHGDRPGREAACAEVVEAYRGACRYGARLPDHPARP